MIRHGGPPVVWAIGTAVALVLTTRPRPAPRRPPPAAATWHPASSAPHLRPLRRRRVADGTIALALWCEAVARAVRAGSALAIALDEAASTTAGALPPAAAAQLAAARLAVRRGATIEPPSSAAPDVSLVLGVLAACVHHGGAAAEPLDRAAAVLRGRAAEAAERSAQSASARLSARVMTLLPLGVLALMIATSPSVRAAVATPAGLAAVTSGGLLNVVGWRWQQRLIRKAAT